LVGGEQSPALPSKISSSGWTIQIGSHGLITVTKLCRILKRKTVKLLHRLSLFVLITLVAVPLVIMAQDNGQQTPVSSNNGVRIAQAATFDPGNIQPARTATLELIEYPTATFDIQPARSPTPELIEYPTREGDDPCANLPPPKDQYEKDLNDMICPPTVTPRPRPTKEPSTSIINGLWVLDPNGSGFTKSGQCNIPGGDNGGMGGEYQPDELPKVPVCMTGDQQWITVDNSGPYPFVVLNTYSTSAMSRELMESNGETTGSININTTRQYRIISPTEIEYAYIRHEEGGCTTTSTVRYKLVEANDLVCRGVIITPEFTAVPTQMPTAQAGETQQPPIIPEPPVQIGSYTIQLPPVDATCSAEQMPPSSNVNVSYDNDQNMFINFGGGSYTLYWNGSDYYEYHKGNQFTVSVNSYPGGASLSWSKQGCFVNSQLSREGAPTATPVPVEPTRTAVANAATIAGSSFSVTADTPAYMCTAENKGMLPDLSGAVLKAEADNNFTFSVGGVDYSLENANGIPGFQQMNPDGSMLVITMNGFYEGNGMGSFMVVSKDGKSCLAQLTFTPQ
jgi:hypothetical protein